MVPTLTSAWNLESSRTPNETFDRVMLKLVPRFQNRGMHLLHGITKFHAKATQYIALPRVVFRVHASLNLLVVDDADAKAPLRLGCVERRTGLLDFREKLLPVGERIA